MVVAKIKSSIFKIIVDAVSEIVDTVVMDFGTNGVTMQAMDNSHVSLCVLELKAGGFSEYVCEKPFNIGISLANMSRIFKCTSTDDELEIVLEDSDKMKLNFTGSSRKSEFEMKLMEIESEYLQVPEVEYECVATMLSSEFQKMVKDIAVIGETCTIDVVDSGMTFLADGDMGQAKFHTLEKDTMKIKGNTKCKFANRYLQMFTKASNLSKSVILKISSDNPMCVEYIIADLGVLKYYLAPKIEDENMD